MMRAQAQAVRQWCRAARQTWRQNGVRGVRQDRCGEAVRMLGSGLRAGLNLPQALALVAAEGPVVLRAPFAQVGQRLQLGMSVDEALRPLHEDIGGEAAQMLCGTVGLLHACGGDLIHLCDQLAATLRERQRVLRRVRVLTTQGMASGMIIAALPLCLGLAMGLIAPHMMTPLFTTAIGQGFLLTGIMLQGAGLWWMRHIVRIAI